MLLFVLHHLGDPLEVEFVKPASFANSFLPHVFGVPKWFLQITALQKPTPVHYSGRKMRQVYSDRSQLLTEEANRRLSGLLEVENAQSGMRTVAWIKTRVPEMALTRRAE